MKAGCNRGWDRGSGPDQMNLYWTAVGPSPHTT